MSTARHVQSPLMNAQRGLAAPSRSWIALSLAVILGAVFVFAGVLKIADPVKFADDIQKFHILPYGASVRLAFYLPWLEVLCGLAVITGWWRSGGVVVLTALTVIFIGATVAAKARGIDVDCGCFGKATHNLTFTWHLLIDFAILAGLLALWWRQTARR